VKATELEVYHRDHDGSAGGEGGAAG